MQKPRETQVKSLGSEGPLEEEMATHSSFLAVINSWTQEHLEGYSTWVAKCWTELSMHRLYMCLYMFTLLDWCLYYLVMSSSITVFVLKMILSDKSIVTPHSFQLHLIHFFHPFSFRMCVSLDLEYLLGSVCVSVLSHFSCVWCFATLTTVALQAPLPMGFFWQEYWSESPCPPIGDLPDPRIEPTSLMSSAWAVALYHQYHLGSSVSTYMGLSFLFI